VAANLEIGEVRSAETKRREREGDRGSHIEKGFGGSQGRELREGFG